VLGVIAHAKVNTHPVQMITSRLSQEPANVQPVVPAADSRPAEPAPTAAWDPHEVWVNRVKKPREKRSA
jgi:hypothetical protein